MSNPRDLPPVHLLALARLLAGGDKGVAPAALSKDLKPLVEHRWSGQEWAGRLASAVDELEAAGSIDHPRDKKGRPTRNVRLTDEGRQLALGALGIEDAPPGLKWGAIRVSLAALALGRPAPIGPDVKYLGGAPGLKAELLRGRYGLTVPGDRPAFKEVADAMAARLIGLEPGEKFTTDNVLRKLLRDAGIEIPAGKKPAAKEIGEALFRRELGDPRAKNPLDLIVARGVGARQNNVKELTDGLLRSWVDRREPKPADPGEAPPAPETSDDLPNFARRVLGAARSSPGGWFGDAKVFIAHVWRALGDDPVVRGLGSEGFKARLIEAHRARLLELGRADLVEAMDPVDVRESATPYLNAVYHFVRTEGQP